jgi:Rieske Fe-S protein
MGRNDERGSDPDERHPAGGNRHRRPLWTRSAGDAPEREAARITNVCLHHGGPLSLEGDTFVCEWHGSTFEARTGKAISGPVRPDARLMMLPTRVEDGVLT